MLVLPDHIPMHRQYIDRRKPTQNDPERPDLNTTQWQRLRAGKLRKITHQPFEIQRRSPMPTTNISNMLTHRRNRNHRPNPNRHMQTLIYHNYINSSRVRARRTLTRYNPVPLPSILLD